MWPPPYQIVVWYPSGGARVGPWDERAYTSELVCILRSGRAVIIPFYKGTYDRLLEKPFYPPEGTQSRNLYVQRSQDLRRSIDYLQTRDDIDIEKLAFAGLSWGGQMGSVMIATESRFRTGIFLLIVNRFRTRWARAVCLIQDVYRTGTDDAPADPLAQVPAPGPSVTWCVSRDEQHQLQQQILSEALHHLVRELQEARKFRDLKIAELVFYCQLSGTAVARLLDVDKVLVRVVKHRCLKRIRADVLARSRTTEISLSFSEDLLTEVWEAQRLSCPKRSTLGAFLLETLSPEWFDYMDFHLTTLGCHFCRASFKDLQEQQGKEQLTSFRRRILTSTAGFLSRT